MLQSVLTFIRTIIRNKSRIIVLKYSLKTGLIYMWTNSLYNLKQYQPTPTKMNVKLENEESEFKVQDKNRKIKRSNLKKCHQYSIITYEKRLQLINLANSKGYSISRAARQLGIKASTGKFIVKCYRDTGKIMKKSQIGIQKPKQFRQIKLKAPKISESEPFIEKKVVKAEQKMEREEDDKYMVEHPNYPGGYYPQIDPGYYYNYQYQPGLNPYYMYPPMYEQINPMVPYFHPGHHHAQIYPQY